MITLFSFITNALAQIQITTDLQEHYLAKEPIVVDILLHNTSEVPVQLPNLEKQTWRVAFTVHSTSDQFTIRSTKTSNSDEWLLQPRQSKKLQFILPNSQSLPVGTHSITLQIDLPTPYTEKKQVQIVSAMTSYADLSTVAEDAYFPSNSYIWTQPLEAQEQALYLHRQRNYYLTTQSNEITPMQSLAKGEERHLYWMQNNQLAVHSLSRTEIDSRQIIASFPWPKTELLTRGATDADRRLHIPIWVAGPTKDASGTVQMLALDNRGTPKYRKILSLSSRPSQTDMALTEQRVPLLLVHHDKSVYLYTLSTVGVAKIDALPPKSTRLLLALEEDIVIAQFGVHDTHGLIIHVITQQNGQFYSSIYSHLGTAIESNTLLPLGPETTITTANYHGSSATILGKQNEQWGILHKGEWAVLSSYNLSNEVYISLEKDHPVLHTVQNNTVQHFPIQ